MRLFIAAELPQNMMEALAETQAMLRDCVRGRFAAPCNLHVTLAFLGEVPQPRISDAAAALEDGCAFHDAFTARLGELGSFGKRANATLWQGFADNAPFLALATDIRKELDAVGLTYDDKPLRAHVTLMRHADLSAGVLPMPVCERGTIQSITLFASELTPGGPIYTPVHTCELAR